METKSYPEMLHDIFIEYTGIRDRVTPFETGVILLIEKILDKERDKLKIEKLKIEKLKIEKQSSNGTYVVNNDIKPGCDSCSWYNTVTDCGLISIPCKSDDNKYKRYRKVHLLPCDRCNTYSVVTRLDKVLDKNTGNILRPMIKFMCLRCNENPIINGTIFRGYELKGLRFTSKYLKVFKQRQGQNEDHKEIKEGGKEIKEVIDKDDNIEIEVKIEERQEIEEKQEPQQDQPQMIKVVT